MRRLQGKPTKNTRVKGKMCEEMVDDGLEARYRDLEQEVKSAEPEVTERAGRKKQKAAAAKAGAANAAAVSDAKDDAAATEDASKKKEAEAAKAAAATAAAATDAQKKAAATDEAKKTKQERSAAHDTVRRRRNRHRVHHRARSGGRRHVSVRDPHNPWSGLPRRHWKQLTPGWSR